mmetsp:Transcript_12960/g.38222  ORF Transcript_12960/g.38222 Transcript_12960/m.38222 type:complete len:380 (-) Transcript_12960:40-1179(-)
MLVWSRPRPRLAGSGGVAGGLAPPRRPPSVRRGQAARAEPDAARAGERRALRRPPRPAGAVLPLAARLEPAAQRLLVLLERRELVGGRLAPQPRADPPPLRLTAHVEDVAAGQADRRVAEPAQLRRRQVLCVQPEDLGAARRLGRSKVDPHVEAREEGRIEVRAPVGRGDERHLLLRVHAVEPPQQHGEHAARRLVHLARARAGERVQLVEEEDAPAEPSALVEEGSELLLRLSVPLRHQCLERDVHEREARRRGGDARRRRLSGPGRAVEEQRARAVALGGEGAGAGSHRREGLGVLQRQEQRLLHLQPRLLGARQRVPSDVLLLLLVPARLWRQRHPRTHPLEPLDALALRVDHLPRAGRVTRRMERGVVLLGRCTR